jgi:HAD superfamily hydrolase (TIGR01549 family)
MTNRRAILFDLYGTLADLVVDEQSENFWNCLADHALGHVNTTGKQLRAMFETELNSECKLGGRNGFLINATFKRFLHSLGQNDSETAVLAFAKAFRKASIVLLKKRPYTLQLLSTLKENGYKLCLVTNTESALTGYDLDVLELRSFFSSIIMSSDVKVKKPEPEMFHLAMQSVDATTAETIMIGDTYETDIAGAIAIGMDALYIPNAEPSRHHNLVTKAQLIYAQPNLASIRSSLNSLGYLC